MFCYLSELEKTLKDNDINALNSSRGTLLHVAAANGHLTIMEYLISKGAKIDVKDKEGRTPLHRAAEKGHGDAVKVLLRHGAFMYGSDAEGKTPLHLAAQNNHSHILKMFLKEEARSCRNQHNFLHMAALKDESSVAKMLLKAGASTDGKDEKGWTALSYAVSQGSENTAKVLLAAGASVDSNMFVTPLHIASRRGNTDVAQQLLHHKAHVNVKDKQSKSPLHFAAERGDKTMVEMLLNAKEKQGSKELNSTGSPESNIVLAWFMLVVILVQISLPHMGHQLPQHKQASE
uniref:Uncharacterized protein n=1 Tax=Falco tinnunculus TaxID=100819 RepID=A0A8C4XV41_FALTI